MTTTERQFSLQINAPWKTTGHGRPIRQQAILLLSQELVAARDFVPERYVSLCGLVRARNADKFAEEPLPSDFPMLVAPITTVRPYRLRRDHTNTVPPEALAQEALANGIEITFEPQVLGSNPSQRQNAIREFCAAVADFLIQPEGSPYSVPRPLSTGAATDLPAAAAANAGAV